MQHSFDIQIAQELGIEKAIILNNMAFWINKNIANNKHLHDGKTYTYNSYDAFRELFPYMKLNTIKRVIRELEADDILQSRCDLNETAYIKTKWYCFGEHSIVKKITIHRNKNNHQKSEIPPSYNDTDINTDINTDIIIKENKEITFTDSTQGQELSNFLGTDELRSLFAEYFQLRKEMKLKTTPTIIKRLHNKLVEFNGRGHNPKDVILNAITANWKDFYEPKNVSKSFQQQERERTSNVVDAVMNGFDPFDPANYENQTEDAELLGNTNV